MNYKMIAVDMDGTLLDSRKQISDETVRAVRQLAESGVLFVISTGRPVQGVEKYKKLLRLTGPVITYNGAMIVNAGTGETLFEQGLRPKDARKIMESGLRYDTTMCIWAGGCLYGNQINAKMNDYKKISRILTDFLIRILQKSSGTMSRATFASGRKTLEKKSFRRLPVVFPSLFFWSSFTVRYQKPRRCRRWHQPGGDDRGG